MKTSNGVNKTISIIVIAFVILIGGYFLFRGENQTPKDSNTQTPSSGVPAPGESATSEATVREIGMTSGNLFFNPKNLTIVKGQPVRITFQNTGTHTFTIDELGVNVALRGSSGVAEFTPTQSGTFEYYCAVPGHREGGMFGSLLVE